MIQVCLRPTIASCSLNVERAEVRLFMKKTAPNTAIDQRHEPHQAGVLQIDAAALGVA